MSYEALNWATKQETKKCLDKLLLIVLSDYADAKNQCYPSLDTLAKLCCCSKSPIQRAVKRLIEDKFISVEKLGKGIKKYNLYTVKATKLNGVKPTTNNNKYNNNKFIYSNKRNKNFIAG